MAKKDFSNESSSSRRIGGVSALLAVGRLGLYAENGFRTLGMPVDSTDVELQERHGALKTYASLKRVKEIYTIAFGLEPAPTEHQLDAALERLNDGELRASDEFFWFWPREREAAPEDDPGLQAIADGNADEALQTWREWEQEGGLPHAVARHNLAVNYLMLALEETVRHLGGTLAKAKEEKLKNAWRNADKRWREVAGDKHVWEETKKRILSKGDPALTAALADDMKADLRKTLSAIHGDIARHYAEKDMTDWAEFHVNAILGDNDAVDDDYRATIREVTKPVRNRLEAARTQAQSYADSSESRRKKQAFAKAKEFFENDFEKKAKPVLDLFYTGEKADDVLKKEKAAIYDKLAETVCQCSVAAFNAKQKDGESTDDDSALGKKLLAIVTDPEVRKRIELNMTGGGHSSDPVVREVMTTLAAVAQGKEKASVRFRKLQALRPKLNAWALKNPGHPQRAQTLKLFAMVERGLSVAIFNEDNDKALALIAIDCAIEDTPDAADRRKFSEDKETLKRSAGHDNELAELAEVIKEAAEGTENPALRFMKLAQNRERFRRWASSNPNNPMREQTLRAFAVIVSKLSVEMFKDAMEQAKRRALDRDELVARISLCLSALCMAIEDTPSDEDRKRFRGEYDQLSEIGQKLGMRDIPKPGKSKAVKSGGGRQAPSGPGILKRIANWLGGGEGKATPESARRGDFRAPVMGRFPMMCCLALSAYLLSTIFQHYLPAGWLVAGIIVQWWHLAIGGAVLALIYPWNRAIYPLAPIFKAFTIWGIAGTAIVMSIVVASVGFHLDVFRIWLWCVTIIGFTVSAMMIGPYWILLFVSQHADGPTESVKDSGIKRMPLFYLGVMFGLFAFSKTHIPLFEYFPMLRWWHFPIFGVALAFFVPTRTYRSSFFLQFYFMTTWPMTLLAWLGLLIYNAVAPEASAVSKCWAPYIGMALGYFVFIFRLERIPISLARMEKAMK